MNGLNRGVFLHARAALLAPRGDDRGKKWAAQNANKTGFPVTTCKRRACDVFKYGFVILAAITIADLL